MKLCERCAKPFDAGRYMRFCDPCRSAQRRKRLKYVATEAIDNLIREVYRQSVCQPKAPRSARLAAKVGWPRWAVTKRARALGLGKAKEKPWSEKEISILERFAWMCDDRIRMKLKAAGFMRSATAIHLKLRRMRFKQNTPYYSATGLSKAFGVDVHVILRWIKEQRLYAKQKGSERTPQQGGDIWMIHENDVYRFVRENPLAFDIRKVDQVWFMDVVFRGKVANANREDGRVKIFPAQRESKHGGNKTETQARPVVPWAALA